MIEKKKFKEVFPLLWDKGEQEEISKMTINGNYIDVLCWTQDSIKDCCIDKNLFKKARKELEEYLPNKPTIKRALKDFDKKVLKTDFTNSVVEIE